MYQICTYDRQNFSCPSTASRKLEVLEPLLASCGKNGKEHAETTSGVTIGRARRAVHAGPALWGPKISPTLFFFKFFLGKRGALLEYLHAGPLQPYYATGDDVRAHDVAKFVEVAGDHEIAVVAIASLNVLVYAMNVDRYAVQKLRLNASTQHSWRFGAVVASFVA